MDDVAPCSIDITGDEGQNITQQQCRPCSRSCSCLLYTSAEKDLKDEPVVNGEVNGDISEPSENKLELEKDSVVENGIEESDEKSVKVESAESVICEDREETKEPEIKENGSGGCSEEEDRNSVTSSQVLVL